MSNLRHSKDMAKPGSASQQAACLKLVDELCHVHMRCSFFPDKKAVLLHGGEFALHSVYYSVKIQVQVSTAWYGMKHLFEGSETYSARPLRILFLSLHNRSAKN